MKKRIKIDSAILSFIIVLTGFLYFFPGLYSRSRFLDNGFDFLGMILILKGTFLRMAARGHKKANSRQGNDLVTTGIYRYVRNPMYLGSFLLGAGFVLIVWPWWALPLYGGLFYARFIEQIQKEEQHLGRIFGTAYEAYGRKTPRFFPALGSLLKMNIGKIARWQEVWDTKDRRGLLLWPCLAVLLEIFQERVVWKLYEPATVVAVFASAMIVFTLGLATAYQRR